MPNSDQAVVERRSQSHGEINTLVEARKNTLALYGRLAAHRPFEAYDDVQELLQDFCESLVDYTAGAHFQLYRHIDENRERRQAVVAVAVEIYPTISDITQSILDFNDKYDGADHTIELSHLNQDLSHLGERLADRIELEDRLIHVMCAPRASGAKPAAKASKTARKA